MMLCSLGGFVFEPKKSEYDRLSRKLQFAWSKKDRIGKNPTHHAVNGYVESYDLKGSLVAKSNKSLDPLIGIAKGKNPVQLTFATGESLKVIIEGIDITKRTFMDNGASVFFEFTVKVKRYDA
jgi:phage protein U